MTTKPYRYDGDQYDDIGGLDTMSLILPVTDLDAVERTEWELRYGQPSTGTPEGYGMEPDERFIFIDADDVLDSRIDEGSVNEVHQDVLEKLIEEQPVGIPKEEVPELGDSVLLGTFLATWKDFKGLWRLCEYGFDIEEEYQRE